MTDFSLNLEANQFATIAFTLSNGTQAPTVSANGFGVVGAVTLSGNDGTVNYYPSSGVGTQTLTITTAGGSLAIPVTVTAAPLEGFTITGVTYSPWDGKTIV